VSVVIVRSVEIRSLIS